MLGRRLKKLILFRLLFAALLLYCPNIFPGIEPALFFGVAALICFASGFYVLWYVTRRRLRWLAVLQITLDILTETYLVYFTGGRTSLFVTLYVISILETALVLGEKRVVIWVTFFSCVCYAYTSFLVYGTFKSGFILSHGSLYFLYGVTVNMVIFTLVGSLSFRLSENIHELQERVRLSERLSSLGEIVSKIAHEIRNPLSSIRTAAEVVSESLKGKLNPQEERMLNIVDTESVRLTTTLQRILGYTRHAPPNPHLLPLDPLMDRVLFMARTNSLVHSNGVLVEKKYEAVKTRIYADEEQIVGAFLNLILNAYQAMPQGGKLIIEAIEEVGGTKVVIGDTGGGIPGDKIKELFIPFKSSKKGGTGLGLAEVHKVVTLHEGTIEVKSESEKGTAFHLYFPKP